MTPRVLWVVIFFCYLFCPVPKNNWIKITKQPSKQATNRPTNQSTIQSNNYCSLQRRQKQFLDSCVGPWHTAALQRCRQNKDNEREVQACFEITHRKRHCIVAHKSWFQRPVRRPITAPGRNHGHYYDSFVGAFKRIPLVRLLLSLLHYSQKLVVALWTSCAMFQWFVSQVSFPLYFGSGSHIFKSRITCFRDIIGNTSLTLYYSDSFFFKFEESHSSLLQQPVYRYDRWLAGALADTDRRATSVKLHDGSVLRSSLQQPQTTASKF